MNGPRHNFGYIISTYLAIDVDQFNKFKNCNRELLQPKPRHQAADLGASFGHITNSLLFQYYRKFYSENYVGTLMISPNKKTARLQNNLVKITKMLSSVCESSCCKLKQVVFTSQMPSK